MLSLLSRIIKLRSSLKASLKSNYLVLGFDGLPLGAWDGLRYFIVALPEPSI